MGWLGTCIMRAIYGMVRDVNEVASIKRSDVCLADLGSRLIGVVTVMNAAETDAGTYDGK